MNSRGLRRYVEDLLHGRRPRPFRADDEQAADLRTAITLRAARPGSGAPTEEFVTGLHRRLASELGRTGATGSPSGTTAATRRRMVQITAAAAAATAAAGAAAGATLDHVLTADAPPAGGATLHPNTGTWHTVATAAELTEGAVREFDVGTIAGFVQRTGGRLTAVSGVCTHLGCRLALNAGRELACPCHNAAFSLTGQLVRHQLRTPPPALPHLAVRERDGAIQIYAP